MIMMMKEMKEMRMKIQMILNAKMTLWWALASAAPNQQNKCALIELQPKTITRRVREEKIYEEVNMELQCLALSALTLEIN